MISRRVILLAGGAMPFLRGQMFADAEAYERFMGRWSRLVAPLLLDFATVPNQGQVLDVGSGTGALAFAIADRSPAVHVVGIDPSAEYVAYANRQNRFSTRVRFQTGDAQDLHFPDASFRASIALLVVNFIPDPRKALVQLRRVTEPRGVIAAAVWDYGGQMGMLRTFWDEASRVDAKGAKADEKHMPLCRARELSHMWKEAGLENVEERPLDLTMKFTSFADYWDPFLLGQGPAGAYVRTLDAGKRAALRQELRGRLSATVESAPFTLPARVWAVRGTVPAHA